MLWTILFLLYTAATLFQLVVWWNIYGRLARATPQELGEMPSAGPAGAPIPLSVIICARNEADNLQRHLPAVLDQEYPVFEVLVVDDDSSDGSIAVLAGFQQKYSGLRVIRLSPKTIPGKKAALAEGIAAARYEYLVFTDADCEPASRHWLAGMATGAEITLGFAPYGRAPGLLNRWIRFETVHTAMQYLSFALLGHAYMGVGRNLAWQKKLFGQVGGFAAHAAIASGDDDLLVNAAAKPGNTSVCLTPETFVCSEAKRTWGDWFRQKRRHLQAGRRYRPEHQIVLSTLALTQILHYFLLCFLLFSVFGTICVVFYGLRMAFAFGLNWKILRRFREEQLLIWFPLFDAVLALYFAVFVPLALIRSNYLISWK